MANVILDNSIKSVLEDFSDIKKNARIGDEDFEKGVKFALLISEGRDKTSAYMAAYSEPDKPTACIVANRMVRTKWVSELINRLVAGNHIIFADKHYSALAELYDIGMDSSVSPKVRVESLKAFVDSTKMPQTKVDTQINISLGSEMTERLEKQLAILASNAKMVTHSGDLVDVEVMK